MMRKGFMVIAAISAAMTVSREAEQDQYLRTLKMEPVHLEYVDSINIDRFDLFQARDIVSLDDGWIVLSAVKGEFKLLFLNTNTSEHFFAIRKGRGPGEMIDGNSLHKHEDGAAFYDMGGAICIKTNLEHTSTNTHIRIDTIGLFREHPAKPIYMTTCGTKGFVSGNLLDDKVWYSYYDNMGHILSSIESLELEEFSIGGDTMISRMLSSVYASNPDGTKVCVANVMCPSLSFSKVESGILTEYKRYSNSPYGIVGGRVTEEFRSTFNSMDADEKYVYVLYSGHKISGDELPSNECVHLIVYNWDGNPVKRYLLNRNVCSVHVNVNILWCTSTYPESCVYKFILPQE